MAFTDFPDQWELYKKERPATAADEIVRWATPVTSFQRTALEDYELSGVQIKKGQRVVMVYRSANFDEDVFDDPFTFNILRDPNPHVGFGGTGAHYCIGANLARMTIDLMFNAIADAHARPGARSAHPNACVRAGSTASNTGRSTTTVMPRRNALSRIRLRLCRHIEQFRSSPRARHWSSPTSRQRHRSAAKCASASGPAVSAAPTPTSSPGTFRACRGH